MLWVADVLNDRVAAGHRVLDDATTRVIAEHRQSYLDAVPIGTAVVVLDGELRVTDRNAAFDDLPPLGGAALIADPGLAARLTAFLSSDATVEDIDWRNGSEIGGRHFTIRFSRLASLVVGQKRCLVALIDRTGEVETQRSLRAELLHDSLTGLPNRAAFDEAIEAAMIRGERDCAVLAVDLLRFSRINECMGAIVGDELIITVARRLMGALRSGDTLARLGGNEFGILLALNEHEGADAARAAADRILAAMSGPFCLSEHEIRIDCAIGVALPSEQALTGDEILRNAQVALKRSKRSGRTELYQPGEVNAARKRFALETELRRAIEADRLTLAWQPLIDLETGRISSFEALARWNDPDRGLISPTEFVPVAEESGLIVPLGRWVLDASLRTLAQWDRRAGRSLPFDISVNLSPVQLTRDDVVAMIREGLSRHAVDPRRLILELTESAIVADPAGATRTLDGLKALGGTIAMDDFGTGYSSLAYLQRLPIDTLKIDRSFVTPMLRDRDSLAIVRAVLSLAQALGMATTAEGVETVELVQTLAALGCSTGQGFHFSRPLPPDDAYAYWLERDA